MLRYLAAFGPTPADAQAWSGVAGLAPTFAALRPRPRTFRGPRGRELLDLPDAPPPEDTPAPVRLPEHDNLRMGHADRSRVVAETDRARLFRAILVVPPSFLVDGTWALARDRLTRPPFARLAAPVRRALEEEGAARVRFVEPDADLRILLSPPPANAARITKA